MLVSIITPTYNSEKYLEECICSIKNQSYVDFEHIIIDGGSVDNTLAIIKKYEGTYPMKWISEKDRGMYDAIAKGFKQAKGDIFCWLNSDDIYMPWTLQTIVNVFRDESISWCIGMPSQIDKNGLLYLPDTKKVTFPRYCIRKGWLDGRRVGCVQQESSFWRRSLYEMVGGLDCKYQLAGDYALWVKFAQKESLVSLNTVLAGFRVHSGQKSEDSFAYSEEAHRLTGFERFLMHMKYYKIVNFFLKKREKIVDVCVYNNQS